MLAHRNVRRESCPTRNASKADAQRTAASMNMDSRLACLYIFLNRIMSALRIRVWCAFV